jgi:hypothetical protein
MHKDDKIVLKMPVFQLTMDGALLALLTLKCRREGAAWLQESSKEHPLGEAMYDAAFWLEEALRSRYPDSRAEQLLEHAEAWLDKPQFINPDLGGPLS